MLRDIFDRLLACYGPQHWWPGETPFEIIVGAVLTQSAAWTNVEKAIGEIKAAGALTPQAMHCLPEERLAELVPASGYYNAKARKLKAITGWIEQYGYDLDKAFARGVPELRAELLTVYGVGEETADSILLYAAGKPVFVIDAYTRRVVSRLGLPISGGGYQAYQALFMDNLPEDAPLFNEYHALLVRLGKEACRKRPLCAGCCLNQQCSLALAGAEASNGKYG